MSCVLPPCALFRRDSGSVTLSDQVPAGRGWDIPAPALLQPQEEGTAGVTLCFLLPSGEVTIAVAPASSQCHCTVTTCL